MSLVTASSKYRVKSLNDWKFLEEIYKIKALDMKKFTESVETGRLYQDCNQQNLNKGCYLARLKSCFRKTVWNIKTEVNDRVEVSRN